MGDHEHSWECVWRCRRCGTVEPSSPSRGGGHQAGFSSTDLLADHLGEDHVYRRSRSQGEDYKAGRLEAIGEYLATYPPSGFTDCYSAEGWTHIARGVLSAAAIFSRVSFPERDVVPRREFERVLESLRATAEELARCGEEREELKARFGPDRAERERVREALELVADAAELPSDRAEG